MRRVTAAVVLGVILAGCSVEPASEEKRDGPGPLSVIAVGPGLPGEDAAGVIAATAIREELIAACMHEAGFRYWPRVPETGAIEFAPGDVPLPGTREFAQRHGYGAWNPPDSSAGTISFEVTLDPEELAYVGSMSAAERDAYDTALWGPVTEADRDGSAIRSGGCTEQQWQAPGADDAERAFLQGVADETHAYLDEVARAPEFDDLNREWAACMREDGHDVISPQATEQAVFDEFSRVVEAADGVITSALVAEHAPVEIALATADADCRVQVDYAARHADVQWDLEQAYVDAHAADLEAYRQAMAD